MLKRIRKGVTVLALYAVALHVILLGMMPPGIGAAANIDAFSIICHTTGPAAEPGEPPAGTLKILPSRAIDHCDLCSAAAPPPAPQNLVDIDWAPSTLLEVLHPVSVASISGIAASPKLARGPPFAM